MATPKETVRCSQQHPSDDFYLSKEGVLAAIGYPDKKLKNTLFTP